MKRVNFQYLSPNPDPSIKFYEIKTVPIDEITLKRLVNVKGIAYIKNEDGSIDSFLDRQYTWKRLQKYLRKYG